jgi:hypothetical protein
MRKVDGYLSLQAQATWPTAIVWKEEAEGNGVDRFLLERQDEETVLLGNVFKEARAGLDALLASERSKRGPIEKEKEAKGEN